MENEHKPVKCKKHPLKYEMFFPFFKFRMYKKILNHLYFFRDFIGKNPFIHDRTEENRTHRPRKLELNIC